MRTHPSRRHPNATWPGSSPTGRPSRRSGTRTRSTGRRSSLGACCSNNEHSPRFTFGSDARINELFPGKNYTREKFSFQLSDHFPVWVQIDTDIDGQRLTQIVQDSQT